jgi:cell division protein FtsB
MSTTTIREALEDYREGQYNRALFKEYIDDVYPQAIQDRNKAKGGFFNEKQKQMLTAMQAETTNQKFINVVPQFECWVKHQRAIKGLRDDAEEQSRTVMDSLNKAKKTKKKYKAKVKDLEQEVEALNDKLVFTGFKMRKTEDKLNDVVVAQVVDEVVDRVATNNVP